MFSQFHLWIAGISCSVAEAENSCSPCEYFGINCLPSTMANRFSCVFTNATGGSKPANAWEGSRFSAAIDCGTSMSSNCPTRSTSLRPQICLAQVEFWNCFLSVDCSRVISCCLHRWDNSTKTYRILRQLIFSTIGVIYMRYAYDKGYLSLQLTLRETPWIFEWKMRCCTTKKIEHAEAVLFTDA